jgi:hypothetical protein
VVGNLTIPLWALIGVVVLLIFVGVFVYFGTKESLKQLLLKMDDVQENRLTAQRRYIETLRRELANIIMDSNLEAFDKAFEWMHNWEQELLRSNRDRRRAEYDVLLKKFPTIEAFDEIGTRHFVRYSDEPSWRADEFVERYKELSKFLVLDFIYAQRGRLAKRGRLYDETEVGGLYDEKEVEVFQRCMRDAKDLRLQNAIKEAMKRRYISRMDRQEMSNEAYSDEDYQVIPFLGVPNRDFTPEIQYGVICKKLQEYGVYSFFVGDDKTYYSYYRSNEGFTKNQPLSI